MIKAIIFDMDGVLIDSVPSVNRAKAKVLKDEHGIDMASIPDPHGEEHKGSTIAALIAAVQQHHGIALDKSDFTAKVVAGAAQDLRDSGVTADAALLSFLDDLKRHNIPLAVATSSVRASAEDRLQLLGIKDYFQVVITADDVTEHKPNPEVYITTMERLHVTPAETFIFEDSLQGIEAAKAAGAKIVGITRHSDKKHPLPHTVLTIDNWSEISYERLLTLYNE